jgi:peptidoglycan/LPS O-acetylase OafA/YrhL
LHDNLRYRADIDGLRAIAVCTVLGFHAFPRHMPGGFIGVDVFFVISGYLITSLITGQLERNNFSILEFYGRRVRRILPALVLVLAASLALGWFVLLADEYRQLGKHAMGGAAFVSNFVLWSESGYFDSLAETKPLLHLWSLAIEEQFYLVWPALLILFHRRFGGFLPLIVLALTLSFAINIHLVAREPAGAFYSPAARAWELMLGALLASDRIGSGRQPAALINAASTLGAALLVAGLFLIDRTRQFPGWWALLPTVGTFLLIWAGPAAWLNRKVLAHPGCVFVGLISYPLYLWHWPLLTFARIVDSTVPPREVRLAILGLSFVAAWATWRLIERPVRRSRIGRRSALALLTLLMTTGVVGYVVRAHGGYPGSGFRDPERQAFLDYFEHEYATRIDLTEAMHLACDYYDLARYREGRATRLPRLAITEDCTKRDPALPKAVLLWGDSHAQQFYYGLKRNLPAGWQILQVASSGCPADADVRAPSAVDYCQQSNWMALKTIVIARPDVVIVARQNNQSVEQFSHIGRKLAALGVPRTLVAGPTPHWMAGLPKIVARKLWHDKPQRTFVSFDFAARDLNERLKAGLPDTGALALIDIMDLFCDTAGCLTYIGDDIRTGLTSVDDAHLLPIASDYLARKLLARMIVGSEAE